MYQAGDVAAGTREVRHDASRRSYTNASTNDRGLVARSKAGCLLRYPAREFVEAGGLIAYAVNYPNLYFRLASIVDKILKGAKPASLPVEQPTRFELVVNLKTAKALGITIPQSVLLRADEVMQ